MKFVSAFIFSFLSIFTSIFVGMCHRIKLMNETNKLRKQYNTEIKEINRQKAIQKDKLYESKKSINTLDLANLDKRLREEGKLRD